MVLKSFFVPKPNGSVRLVADLSPLNEYIELSKDYSSKKSKIFINGILDKLVEKLLNEGEIKKLGRGLIQ